MRTTITYLSIFILSSLLLSQERKLINVGSKVADQYPVSLYINKVEVTSNKIVLQLFFKNYNTLPRHWEAAEADCGLKGAYYDDYKNLNVRGISFGSNYRLKAGDEKSFTIDMKRPVGALYLTGINLDGKYANSGPIKISNKYKGSKYKADISAVVASVPFKQVKVYAQSPSQKDTKKPTLLINSPVTIQGIFRTDEFSTIISGRVSDDKGVGFVMVNGKNASLKSDGRFQKRVKLKIGINPITIMATDINDNIEQVTLTVIREEIFEDEEFSDVDFAPETRNKNLNGIAVVFGIEDYQYAPSVSHAYNDANIFREYLIKTFGLSRENIYFRTNERATKGEFEKIFNEGGWIDRNSSNKSDVIIFYAGHGAPDLKSKQTYLIPYDIDPNYATTGYALTELYQNLGKFDAKSITVLLDACFSGGSRDNQSLLANARPIYISIEETQVSKNTTVFTAASGNEISSAYEKKLHGLFTYFFLKGLNGEADKNKDKKITVEEMQNYLSETVPLQARRMGREQHPELIGSKVDRILLRY